MAEKKKKKETTFIEKEGGLIFQSEDGNTLAVGFPSEIETMTAKAGKGGVSIKGVSGELKGESYRKVKYNWHIISLKELSSTDVEPYTEGISSASGTLAASFHVTQPPRASALIVDDNENLCATLSFILSQKGYTTAIAHNGPDAIKQIEETPFDLVLMDIKMPGMTGVKALKKIKKLRPKTSVVMMTGYIHDELVQEVLENGAFGIVYKPVDIEEVVSLIEEAIAA